ncbi:hypothetical protein LJC42_03800 [Eubacteriales bacterium OttesenSCG-928-K08]|nr:hypothetical protein [Eubacteriales bacterium OttesenSCG-928-K08]
MKKLHVMFTMDCEARNDIATEGGPPDWAFCRRSMEGYTDLLLQHGYRPTLFVVPQTAQAHSAALLELKNKGAELGLHLHPQDFGYADYLGGYSYEEQVAMLDRVTQDWADALGFRPESFRGGNFSGNDATAPALSHLGYKQGSLSVPGRNFTRVKSNWAGAEMWPHHMHKANRLLAGDMNFLEVPATADWESVMWGGLTKLELRIEMVDARAHGFTIRKSVERQREEGIEEPYLCALTHNIFDYTDLGEFRRQVLEGVLQEISACADQQELAVHGCTLQEYHTWFHATKSAQA